MTNETFAEREAQLERTVDAMTETVATAIGDAITTFQRDTIEHLGDAMSTVAKSVLHQAPTLMIAELTRVLDWLREAEGFALDSTVGADAAESFTLAAEYVEGRIAKWRAGQGEHEVTG